MKKFLAACLLFLTACQATKYVSNTPLSEEALYENSITESMSPNKSKIAFNLVAINKENKNLVWKNIDGEDYILVVTWNQESKYYKPYLDSAVYNTGKYPIWITTAPELKKRMEAEKATNISYRLKQLLGLPPTGTYDYFIEFWVKPSDLFRPCPDKEINDSQCDLCFPKEAEKEHIQWINEYRINSYYNCELYKKYPWTQLGYTYDWNPDNKTHIGLSEFVIPAGKNIVVKAIYTTEEYFK